MIRLLAKWFIKDYTRTQDPSVRLRYGALCGIVGICFNVMLVAGKLLGGAVSGSLAVTADALNNLGDVASSIIVLVGFRISGKQADREHPFGHGRYEYIAGLIVAVLILVMGVELLTNAVKTILAPKPVIFSWLTVGILAVSLLVKLVMYSYNDRFGKRLQAPAMRAAALDSVSDVAATFGVLLSMFLNRWTGWPADGWAGALMALWILYSGVKAVRETISPLLGEPPKAAFIQSIEKIVLSAPEVVGMHDLAVHEYGQGRVMVTLHAEVPAEGDILVMHDAVDNLEKRLQSELGCEAVIHMDPVVTGDEKVARLKEMVAGMARDIDQRLTIHDFRYVPGVTHTNLVFDVVVPFGFQISDDALRAALCEKVRSLEGAYYAVVEVDKSFVG